MPHTHNRYYVMRHGESLANRRGLIVSDEKNALNDYGLTARGAEQVMQAALNTRLDRHTIIVSSDFKRAQETAQIIHSVVSFIPDIEYDPLLRERRFGKWELSEQENYHSIWQHDLTHPETVLHGVESVTQTLERGQKVIARLEQTYKDQTILLVGHGDVLQILMAHHHNINPRFHRSLSVMRNADIRALAQLNLKKPQQPKVQYNESTSRKFDTLDAA